MRINKAIQESKKSNKIKILSNMRFVFFMVYFSAISINGHCQKIQDNSPKIGALTTIVQDGCGCTFTKVEGGKETIFVSSYGKVNGDNYAYMFVNGKVERFIQGKTINNVTTYYNETYIITQTAKPSKKIDEELFEESGVFEIKVRKPPIGQPGNYKTQITYFGECGC